MKQSTGAQPPGSRIPRDGIRVFDRKRGRFVTETVLGARWMRLAYNPAVRPITRFLLFQTGWASRLLGWYCDTPWSRRNIGPAIRDLGIDPSEFAEPVESFRSFNDFFTRRLRPGVRPFDSSPEVLVAPADARTLVFPALSEDAALPVKGAAVTAGDLLGPLAAESAARFAGGSAVVARLCPADYHRFHFPASGRTLRRQRVPGRYESVNPWILALGIPVFRVNVRDVSLLDLQRFGRAAMIEVGAFGVGGIVQTHRNGEFEKMAEKGFFRFGGSTVILLFQPGVLRFDPDLVERSAQSIETLVRAGERLGVAT